MVLFLCGLAAVWGSLMFLVWPSVQPLYASLVTGTADAVILLAEHDDRVTTLTTDGTFVFLKSGVSSGKPAIKRFDARALHFYVVACLSIVLVFPGLRLRRRVRILGVTMLALFGLHVLTLLVDVEAFYATEVASLSRQVYTTVEREAWRWLDNFMVGGAVQLAPAVVLAILVIGYAGSGLLSRSREGRPGPSPREPASRGRSTPRWAIRAGVSLAALAVIAAVWVQTDRISGRQGEKESALGYQALQAGASGRAASHFGRALEKNPRLTGAHIGLGEALIVEGRSAQAVTEFDEAIALLPDDPAGHAGLGRALFRESRFDQAITEFGVSLELQPRQPRVLYYRALALKIVGRRAAGEADLKSAIAIDPTDADAVYELAASMINSHRACEAVPYLAALARLEPDSERGLNASRALGILQDGCPAI